MKVFGSRSPASGAPRRRARGLSFGALVVSAMLLVGACGDDDDDAGGPATTSAGGGTGTTAGSGSDDFDPQATVTHGATSPVPHFDAHRFVHVGWYEQLNPFYSTLVEIDKDNKLVSEGALAEEWTVSQDGRTITLRLRQGTTFHDGSPIDAAAVKANLDRGKTLQGSTVATMLASVASVEARDPRTVVLSLSKPDASVLAALTTPAGMIMNPKGFAGEFPTTLQATAPLGSGAYRLVEWRQNQAETFEKYDGYFDKELIANAPRRVEIVTIPDINAKLAAFRTGEWDSLQASGLEEQITDLVRSNSELAFDRVIGSTAGFFLGLDRPPFNNPQARQALAHAINAQELTSTLLSIPCGVVAPNIVTPDHWSVPDNIRFPYSFDAARARQLVQQLGGLSFSAAYSPGTLGETLAKALQAQLSAVGINMEVVGVPGGQSVPAFLRGDHSALINFTASRPDPHLTLTSYLIGGYNVSRSAEVKQLAERAVDSALSQDERARIYADVWQKVNEEAAFVPVCYTTSGFAHRANVVGWGDHSTVKDPDPDWRRIRVRR